MNSIAVVWTNDDIGFGKSEELRRALHFLDRHGIPGVFFVIPWAEGERTIDQDRELVDLMLQAAQKGHEFYQHGYRHRAFECGVPEQEMLAFSQEARRQFDEERESIELMHTFEAQVKMLAAGQRIWRKTFGEDSQGFRPGWGAFCSNLYRALATLGFDWVSSRIPCMTSWQRNAGKWDQPIDFRQAIPTAPHRLSQGIIEFPMAGDYAFRVPSDPQKIDSMVNLGLEEFQIFSDRNHPMLIVSHWHGLEQLRGTDPAHDAFPNGTGYLVHEKLIPAILSSGRARFTGMRELMPAAQHRENTGETG